MNFVFELVDVTMEVVPEAPFEFLLRASPAPASSPSKMLNGVPTLSGVRFAKRLSTTRPWEYSSTPSRRLWTSPQDSSLLCRRWALCLARQSREDVHQC